MLPIQTFAHSSAEIDSLLDFVRQLPVQEQGETPTAVTEGGAQDSYDGFPLRTVYSYSTPWHEEWDDWNSETMQALTPEQRRAWDVLPPHRLK